MIAATGIVGLDAALHGGLPRGRSAVIVGSPGSGKTMLGLQFLINGVVQSGEPALMITFEESPAALRSAASSLGLPTGPAGEEMLQILDARPSLDSVDGGAFDLSGLAAIVGAQVRRSGIRRTVFDGLDALFMTPMAAGLTDREFRRLIDVTNAEGITSLVTLKQPSAGGDYLPRRFRALEYAADAVIRLDYRISEGLLQRILRIVKVRGAGFAGGEHPFIIDASGLDVSFSTLEKLIPVLSLERVSLGITQLDEMLEGGLLRSTVTLISGLPGTAKSTIGAAFLFAGLQRGERCLLVALDEPAEQLIANVRSVGIELEPYVESGELRILSLNAGAAIAEEQYLRLKRAVDESTPTLLVIDPVSALEKSGGAEAAALVDERLVALVKERGIAAIFTAIASAHLSELEATSTHVSMIADTWIHLTFAVQRGERNRTITIVKSRGTAHSNQMRELSLTREGIVLEHFYELEGDLLLGTARLQREQRDKREAQARETGVKSLLHDLAERKEALNSRLRDAERELLELENRMATVVDASASLEAGAFTDRDAALTNREMG